MENDVVSNPGQYFSDLVTDANWMLFAELFKASIQNIPTSSIYDSIMIAAHARIVIEYLHKHSQYIKYPGKLPKDVVDLALKDS